MKKRKFLKQICKTNFTVFRLKNYIYKLYTYIYYIQYTVLYIIVLYSPVYKNELFIVKANF